MGMRYSCLNTGRRIVQLVDACAAGSAILLFLFTSVGRAESIPVHYPEGASRGFLVLRDLNGKTLASGETRQVVKGGRVSTRLIFRFCR